MHSSGGLERRRASCERPTPIEHAITTEDSITDLIAEARAVDWDFTHWCYVSGYDASDPDARNMFECLLAYARSEGRTGLH
jgi:hypothetical protein